MIKKSVFILFFIPGYLMAQPGNTTSHPAGAQLKTSLDSFSYAAGYSTALNLKGQGIDKLNASAFTKAMEDVMNNKTAAIGQQQINEVVNRYLTNQMTRKLEQTKTEGAAFLAKNKKRAGVIVTPSGLQYEIIKTGTGPKPVDGNNVKVHYTGYLVNGKKFQSSLDFNPQPMELNVNGVIAGWTEALKMMPVGSKWKLFIPAELAYGDRSQGADIPAGSTLIFEIELFEISK